VSADIKHHPVYCVARGWCWAYCYCDGWKTDPKIKGNLMWAQLEFGKHLVAVHA
jgi:hypothetical protein